MDHETTAWKFIRDLPVDAIITATSPRVVQTINPAVRSCFQSCCLLALQKIQDDPSDVSAWKLFLFDYSHDSYASRQRRTARHQEHEGGVSEIPIVGVGGACLFGRLPCCKIH